MRNPMSELLDTAIDSFKSNFLNCRKLFQHDTNKNGLTHAGEFGRYRENICAEFIQQFLPNHMKISNGFLINKTGEYSNQTDLVIYDFDNTPKLEKSGVRFFPTETTYAIGEIKSVLTISELEEVVKKIRITKKLRKITPDNFYPIRPINLMREIESTLINWQNISYIYEDNEKLFLLNEEITELTVQKMNLENDIDEAENNSDELREELDSIIKELNAKQEEFERDLVYNLKIFEEMNLVSFIICEEIRGIDKLNEDRKIDNLLVNLPFEDEPFNFNIILSIKDGIIFHRNNGIPYPFPTRRNQKSGTYLLSGNTDDIHIKTFLWLLLEALNKTASYEFNPYSYLFKSMSLNDFSTTNSKFKITGVRD